MSSSHILDEGTVVFFHSNRIIHFFLFDMMKVNTSVLFLIITCLRKTQNDFKKGLFSVTSDINVPSIDPGKLGLGRRRKTEQHLSHTGDSSGRTLSSVSTE